MQSWRESGGYTCIESAEGLAKEGWLGMSMMKILTILIVASMAAVPASVYSNGEQCNIDASVGQTWLATGTVTRIDGSVFYLLGKDNVIYKIDTQSSEVFVGDSKADHYTPKIGDTVRVYGTVGDGCKIEAARVRVFAGEQTANAVPVGAGPEKEIKIIIRREPSKSEATAPESCKQSTAWRGRGLITDIDFTGKRLKIQTPSGHYTIDVADVPLIYGATTIGMGSLNQGDAVKISGNLVGVNEVQAQVVRITRTRSESENALPLTPASVVGMIEQIDYPSMTFRMRTESFELVISMDEDTIVQQQMIRMSFMDLKPGMKIKMSGNGSPGTGYAASHIQIIGVAP